MTKVGLYIALVGSSLICLPWMRDAFGQIKVLTALIGVGLMWWAAGDKIKRSPIDWPVLFCLFAVALSTACSVGPMLSIVGFYSQPFYSVLVVLCSTLIFYAVRATSTDWIDGPQLCFAVVAVATGLACAIEHAFVCAPPFDLVSGFRAVGTIGNAPFMGAMMAMSLPICVWLWQGGGESGRLGGAGVLFACFAILASGSRGPIIAAGSGVVSYLVLIGIVRINKRNVLLFSLFLIGLFSLWLHKRDPSDIQRYEIWAIALSGGAHFPFLGWGPDSFFVVNSVSLAPGVSNYQASAHNDLLQVWATMGAVGLIGYVWLWWAALRAAYASHLDDISGKSAACLGMLVALFFSAKFNPVPGPAHFLAAAVLGSLPFRENRPLRFAWYAGFIFLLIAPGLALQKVISDGKDRIEVRIK